MKRLIFPSLKSEKPTFRQLISHNIRYKDESVNNTLKTLNRFTRDVEYETLYLYLLGCTFEDADKKQSIIAKLRQEQSFKDRLERDQTRNSYEVALDLIENEIADLDAKKSLLNINENFESDLNLLNKTKYEITKSSSLISKLSIRRDIILDAQREMEESISNIDIRQLEILYSEAKNNLEYMNKTFENLVNYHNKMIVEKVNFITKDLPDLERQISYEQNKLNKNLKLESELSKKFQRVIRLKNLKI